MASLYKKDRRRAVAVDPAELKIGIETEMEHTDDRRTARIIALDHLGEIPDYYSRLTKMEHDYFSGRG